MKGPGIAAGLVLSLLLGFVIARATTPPPAAATQPTTVPSHSHGGAILGDLGGVSLSAGGFTLVPSTTTLPVGGPSPYTFKILNSAGKVVTDFIVSNDKPLHLIVARHDLTGFQHLHPAMAADGVWSVPLTLGSAGIWRLYTDFTTTDAIGLQVTIALAADVTVTGDYRPVALPAPNRVAEADGLTVTMEGTPALNAAQPLSMRVLAGGAPVSDLERYLGSYGHLVVLRDGDLGYLHVHPEDQLISGAVKFWLTAPSPGRYRMFFEFQRSGAVHRAEFTVDVQP